jgi:glycosyltransferase involved in cell wall biosynthesis
MSGTCPTVSVCIPTFNRAAILAETLQSVLSQTFTDFEVVISDNASEDDTAAVVHAQRDGRIRYHRQPRNIGPHENFKHVFRLATGRYIAPLTDDDIMLPDNLERKVAVLSAHPDVGLVHSKYHVIDATGRILRTDTNWGHGPDRYGDAVESGRVVLEQMLLTYNRINLPTVVFRRACHARLGSYCDGLTLVDDWEYWMRIAAYYDIAFLAQPLVMWRFHARSQTMQHALSETGALTTPAFREHVLAKRLILNRHLRRVPDARGIQRRVWNAVVSDIVLRAEAMLTEGTSTARTREFLLQMCRTAPEIMRHKHLWKCCLKTVLSPRHIALLRRIFPTA